MNYALFAPLFTLSLLFGMLLCLEVGRRIGLRRRAKAADGTVAGSGAMEGAVFALLGLLVAFSFSGAATRFDTRRQLIVEETNAVGTAYLRLDLLPAEVQPTLRARFRQYLATRLEGYRKASDAAAVREALRRSGQLQGEIWTQAVAGSRLPDAHPDAAKLLLPALNAMIDITTTRHPGDAHASTDTHLCDALHAGTRRCAAGWPWHGRRYGAELAPHRELCGHDYGNGVCHSRSGVPTSGVDPGDRPLTTPWWNCWRA